MWDDDTSLPYVKFLSLKKLISLSDKHCKTDNRCLERQNRRKCVDVVQFCVVMIVVLVDLFRA